MKSMTLQSLVNPKAITMRTKADTLAAGGKIKTSWIPDDITGITGPG